VFLYPWAVIFRQLEIFGLVEMGLFLVAIVFAYAYVLSAGALDWGPARRVGERVMTPVLRASAWSQSPPLPPAAGEPGPGEAA
jgi:hypothetical protein